MFLEIIMFFCAILMVMFHYLEPYVLSHKTTLNNVCIADAFFPTSLVSLITQTIEVITPCTHVNAFLRTLQECRLDQQIIILTCMFLFLEIIIN